MARLAEQERARNAHEAVKRWAAPAVSDKDKKAYRQELQQLPARILASGLGQTLAFYASKGGVENRGVEADVGAELARFLIKKPRCIDLLEHLTRENLDLAEYRRLTREALAYAEWLKRYAAALLPKPDSGRAEGGS
ncbi:MAG TPA: type III-B CRISPR module-associated protein Cmr5 [Thermodesulfobacteriota bacterium]|nr:type III-B CRISPR module-associated protein Cmr5 [Thermodesulfobacteriota bacterium]